MKHLILSILILLLSCKKEQTKKSLNSDLKIEESSDEYNITQNDKLAIQEKKLKVGKINDPDGYTNVREKPEINSKIIAEIFENEFFHYYEKSKNNWFYVITNAKIKGYVHKSRLEKVSPNKVLQISINKFDKQTGMDISKDTIVSILSLENDPIYLINNFNYLPIEKKSIEDKSIAFSNPNYHIVISKNKFERNSHNIEYEEEFINTIDGEKVFGIENRLPNYQIEKIEITDKKNSNTFLINDIKNLFEPNLDKIKVFERNNNSIIIWMMNGDGAGAYSVFFITKKDKLLKKIIYTPF